MGLILIRIWILVVGYHWEKLGRNCVKNSVNTVQKLNILTETGLLSPAPNRQGHKVIDAAWRLFVVYIGPQSRTERPRKTKIDTEVAHTRDSDTTFKIKRSRSPGRFSHRGLNGLGSCSGVRGKLLLHCSVLGGARRFGAHRGRTQREERGGAYRGGAGRVQLVKIERQSIRHSCEELSVIWQWSRSDLWRRSTKWGWIGLKWA